MNSFRLDKIMRRFVSTISLVVLVQYIPASVQAQEIKSASGLPSDPIQAVVAARLMTNDADGKFNAQRFITRAELASILVKSFRLEKREASRGDNLILVQDVPTNHPAYKNIQIVLKNDIMRGYRGNMFFPNQRVTRAEALAIFAQAYGVFQFPDDTVNEILASHPDAGTIPTWAKKAIATVLTEGFVNTDNQGNISPLQPMTRGDMAYVLSKYLQRQQVQPETPEAPPAPNR
jgi:hypothetical protein